MAKVTFNPSIQGFHGTLDNLVFYSVNGRTLIRSKGTVTKPQSRAQKAVREAFRAVAACWMELSREQKEPWRVYGTAQGMTGYNAFQKANVPRLKQGIPVTIILPVMSTHAQTPHIVTPADAGCGEFMASIREMVRRVSGECQRAGTGRAGRPARVSSDDEVVVSRHAWLTSDRLDTAPTLSSPLGERSVVLHSAPLDTSACGVHSGSGLLFSIPRSDSLVVPRGSYC